MKNRLESCKTCSRQVAIFAKACPHCGQPNPVANVFRLQLLVVGFIVLAVVVLAAIMISRANQTPF